MKNHFVKGAKNASKSITLLICVARRLNCSAGFAFLGLRFLPQLPGPNRAFSFSSGRRSIQTDAPHGLVSPGMSSRPIRKGENMQKHLSPESLALIVSEIVEGYGKIIKRKGKLYAVSSR